MRFIKQTICILEETNNDTKEKNTLMKLMKKTPKTKCMIFYEKIFLVVRK